MNRRVELLDYARFSAALSVLAFHYLFAGIRNGKLSSLSYIPVVTDIAKYGYLGVELFFMISGYVIFATAKDKSPGQFIVSRIARLYRRSALPCCSLHAWRRSGAARRWASA